jgi:hypothetical protein
VGVTYLCYTLLSFGVVPGYFLYIGTTIEVVRQNTEVQAGNVAVPKLLGMSFAKNKHPMYVCDLNTLAFLDVNDAAVRDYGHSRRWFLGATILDIRPTTEIPRLLEQMRAPSWKTSQNTTEKWCHQAKNGTVFPVAIRSWELTFRGHSAKLVRARERKS